MKTILVATVGAVVGSFAIRIAQIISTTPQEPWWWVLEATRWGLVAGGFAALALAVSRLQARVQDHEERLAQIAQEALWARLELDVVELKEYSDRV